MARSLIVVLFVAAFYLTPAVSPPPAGAQERAVGGEDMQPAARARDANLQQFATEHARRGNWIAAMRTLSGIADGPGLAEALDEVQSVLGQTSRGAPEAGGSVAVGDSGGAALSGSGPGGASFADFAPLIDLIQSTISPDMWEEAGGSSTVRPYPGGILVDPSGLVTDFNPAQHGDQDQLLADIAVLLAADQQVAPSTRANPPAAEAWRLPARHRCVSLRHVAQQVLRHRLSGTAIDDALRHLAGLSRIDYVVLRPEHRDVVLIGTVGGIEMHQGWLRDRRSGLPAMRLDFLAAAAAAVVAGQPLGCSIDPTPQALATAADVGEAIRSGEIPSGLAADALRRALGEQTIRVFGLAGDTPLAYLMVEADRHMKQLSLGLAPMPRGTHNYLDVVSKHIGRGPPDGQLLRLWFMASPVAVRMASNGRVYQLGGRPMKLASETQLAGAKGNRLASADDFRLVEFVQGFNHNLDEIIRNYPAYGALQSVYHAAGIAEVLRRSEAHSWNAAWLAPLLLDDVSAAVTAVPKRVDSIAAAHRVKHGGRRHLILLASGGVRIDPADTLAAEFQNYPTLDAVAGLAESADGSSQHWWWDAP